MASASENATSDPDCTARFSYTKLYVGARVNVKQKTRGKAALIVAFPRVLASMVLKSP